MQSPFDNQPSHLSNESCGGIDPRTRKLVERLDMHTLATAIHVARIVSESVKNEIEAYPEDARLTRIITDNHDHARQWHLDYLLGDLEGVDLSLQRR